MIEPNTLRTEVNLIIEAIKQQYGYDFSNYSRDTLYRRLVNRVRLLQLDCISDLIPKIIHDPIFFEVILRDFSITVTEMFRDPHVFLDIRKKLIPFLKTYSKINIWHAGCATGQEAYSMAIVLHEAGLLDRCQIHATDFNNQSLDTARKGSYKLKEFDLYQNNYIQSGGPKKLNHYFSENEQEVTIIPEIKKAISFSNHNLFGDQVFAQMHVIFCRNVMIYFNQQLSERCIQIFKDSLIHKCFLVLGQQESLEASKFNSYFDLFEKKNAIYRKRVKNDQYKN